MVVVVLRREEVVLELQDVHCCPDQGQIGVAEVRGSGGMRYESILAACWRGKQRGT